MFIDKLLNKSVRSDPTPKTRGQKIRLPNQKRVNLSQILIDIRWCYERTEHQKELSPVERIVVESKWTDSLLTLLSIGNSTVMQSIHYRLCEQTPEENEEAQV